MNFSEFIQSAWQQHASDTETVAQLLRDRQPENAKDVAAYAQIVVHVFAEHLGKYAEGTDLLGGLLALCASDEASMQALARSIATLEVCAGKPVGSFPATDAARIHAMAASALCGAGESNRAKQHLEKALTLAEKLSKDPAFRAIAVSGNNIAAGLEEKKSRTAEEVELMLFAASVGRKYWELAGTWLETERAEYRWAKSCLAAGKNQDAMEHARACLSICENNHAEAMELFCAHEVIALCEKAQGKKPQLEAMRRYFEQLGEEDKSWFKSYFAAFD
jgi:hypothetical protein